MTSAASSALDPDQRLAVEHIDGPCLVLAGPGTGKTRVIVERFLRLLDRGIAADQQLVLTYTRRAADEMRGRAEQVIGPFDTDAPLTTYHAFAFHVVRNWGWLAGVSPVFRVADAAERWLHVEAVLEELRPRALWNPLRPHELMDPLLSVITCAKQELVTPEQYAAWARKRLRKRADDVERVLLERHAAVADVYARLDERYRRHGIFDHDDCILYAERLIREQPAVRAAIAGRIRYVMVDEYQDTNYAQAKLVETLTADHGNVLVVADDDQSIYKFRGASRANLERFSRVHPQHQTITLTHNYRSTSEIVGATRLIIGGAGADTRIEKRLAAERGPGAAVEVWAAPDERAEVVAVAQACREMIDSGTRPADIAWLFRQHAHMEAAMHALREIGVPYQVSGGRGFFQEREVKDALALLAAAQDPGDTQAVLRCLHLPAWRVSGRGRSLLAAAVRDDESPLLHLVVDERIDGINEDDRAAALRCAESLLELHAMSEREDVRDVFFAAVERSEFLGILDEEHGVARAQMSANINKVGELLESFADWSDDRRIATALHYLDVLRNSREASELPSIDPIEEGVVLLTAHGAKGLEWPIVFLARCTGAMWAGRPGGPYDIQLPDELVPEPAPVGDAAVDEERRLFYVASTRARDRLVFAWSKHYARAWSRQQATPFLATVFDSPISTVDVENAPPVARRPRRAVGTPVPQRPTLAVSDLRVFKSCPRRFEYRAIWKLPVRDTVQSWFGTLVHEVLRVAATQRANGVDVNGDLVEHLWHEAWEASRGPKGLHAELRTLGAEQLRRYVESDAWREASIEAVEDRVVVPVQGAEIVGRFDRVDADSGTPTVVDYKTSRPKDADSLARDLQVRAYAVALSQRAKTDHAAVELHYLQTGQVSRVEFDREALDRAFRQLSATTDELVRAWRDSDFPPKPSAWQCPRCEYRTVCNEGRELKS
ncbi:MAG: ATP-dependent helicase [Candidatus Dormibacteraeota bacterium]|nr:ATP-dependent helicase [Candidatus Dormibacteraeota bacterium]